MKTFQRILAVVLCLVMSLSVLGTVAFAAEGDPQTTAATIDTSKKGSITVHKYEYNGTEKIKGTGAATDEVPEGANKLAGAGFTIYKVEDVNALTQYYSTAPTDLPSVDTYTENGAIKADYASMQVGTEVKTGTDGIAKFENLALGLYVVIETTKPDSVTKPCNPFILSVPMTSSDGDNWLYDIHVFPKNGTSYGEIELVKKGENNDPLEGVTFVLQKKNADNITWTDITKKAGASGDNTGDELTLVTDANGKITVAGLSNGTYRFIETDLGTNKNAGYILNGAATYEFTVNSGKITYNGTESENATITVTNEKPDAEKEVKDDEGSWGDDADYSVGDTIEYKITVSVPTTIESLRTFTVTDTPTHLIDDVASVKVYQADGTTQITGITATAISNGGFTIEFNSYADEVVTSKLAGLGGTDIIIKYNAVLQAGAVVSSTGNPNTVELKYSNAVYPNSDPTNPNNGKDPKEDKITDQAIVYTFELDVQKNNEQNTALKDVEFDLYLYNGTETNVTENLLTTSDDATKIGHYTTDEDGKIVVSGLENGNYYLVETKTNAEYNLLNSPVKVEINVAYTTKTSTTTTYNENGDVIATTVTNKTFTETNGTENDGIFGTTIINKKGFELPTTGGIGTLMFFIIGGVLIAGGICLITVPNKKRSV